LYQEGKVDKEALPKQLRVRKWEWQKMFEITKNCIGLHWKQENQG